MLIAVLLFSFITFAAILHAQQQSGQAQVSVSKDGDGAGTVISSPPGIECGDQANQCSVSFALRTPVTLSAKPSAMGSVFAGWSVASGSASACSGSKDNCRFILIADTVANAHFTQEAAQQFTISVTVAGNGAGVVTSTPTGIQCGSEHNQCSAKFAPGTKVSLDVTTVESEFQGWSSTTGSASICEGTIKACNLAVSEDSAITATFTRK
jgi:hypothetical protein